MKDSIILQGKTYISARRAAKIMNYAQDYIGQLCRGGKVDSTMVGRSWFVTEESLLAHRQNTVDATSDRSSKNTKNISSTSTVVTTPVSAPLVVETAIQKIMRETREAALKNQTAPVASPIATPVVSPIQTGGFKYEADNSSPLPEIRKNVPVNFSLPKNIASMKVPEFRTPMTPKVATAGVSATMSVPSSSINPAVVTLIVVALAATGIVFSLSLSVMDSTKTLAQNEASVGTATADLLTRLLQNLGLRPKTASVATTQTTQNAATPSVTPPSTTAGLNGIGIFPATSPDADSAEKAKIQNSFSDEVVVSPDQGGRAGVITPVFQKTNGNDFVYVLVPVKEKKQ